MRVVWKASIAASCVHAMRVMRAGQTLVDARWSEILSPCAERLELLAAGEPRHTDEFWRRLAPLAALSGSPDELDRAFATSLAYRGETAEDLLDQDAFREVLASMLEEVLEVFPTLGDQLRSRERPLREQWEARGPGMLRRISRQLPFVHFADTADIYLVQPVTGGGGSAHPEHALILLEAMLANPHASLPEPVRAAWLLTQLGAGAPPLDQAPEASGWSALGLLPAVLQAGEHVEFCRYHVDTVSVAIQAWLHPPVDADRGTVGSDGRQEALVREVAGTLTAWWDSLREPLSSGETAWEGAIRTLCQRLPSSFAERAMRA